MSFGIRLPLWLLLAPCGLIQACAAHLPSHGVAYDADRDACRARVVDLLHFGLSSPDGPIDDAAWDAFLAQAVTPRFPDGFTVLDARGQWRGADGRIDREASRVLEVVHADDADARAALRAIVADYRTRFRQESVLRLSLRGIACL